MISNLLRRLLDLIRSRFLWISIGLALLVLLIWHMGPLFAFGEFRPLETVRARIWCIGIILSLLLLRILVRHWHSSRINDRITNMLSSALSRQKPVERSAGNIEALEEKFDEALKTLRRARFNSGNQSWWGHLTGSHRYLYQLPWYVIIGAPGAGKTTALVNSGLSFPLAKQFGDNAVRGVGGTRYCDWWFTNEAVFIDTAGRYTTHESDIEVDRAEWQEFLALLKKNRARQPINGVLVTLSVAELLEKNTEQRSNHAATIRSRLDELQEGLGIAFPVYVLVTKSDLLLGFDEYFASLDKVGREQVYGFTLPMGDASQPSIPDRKKLKEEFGLLHARIVNGLIDRLQAEPDLNRRSRIFGYPQEFGAVSALVLDCVVQIFAQSRYSSPPMLRGIYFTSGTQEGAPFDRILSAMGESFGPRHKPRMDSGSGKSFFLHEPLTKVIFGEAHLVSTDAKAERRSRLYHGAVYAACLLLLCSATGAWIVSYRNNQSYISSVDAKIDQFENTLQALPSRNDSNLYAMLPILDAARKLPDGLRFEVERPLVPWTFGLYQGDKLNAVARPLYHRLLVERFAPTLKMRLEQLLRTVAVNDLEFSFEILKAYIMMHEPAHLDKEAFVAFVLADWDYNLPAGAALPEREALERHVRTLIAIDGLLPTTPMDTALVEATRSRLAQYSISQRIYRRMVRLLKNNRLADFSVGASVGSQASRVFRRLSGRPLTDGIPSLYTYRGYHDLFVKELDRAVRSAGADDSWVLGVSEATLKDRLQAIQSGILGIEVKRHYANDYIQEWEHYLDDIALIEPTSLAEAAELASMLSAPDSPLMRFMQAVVKETTLSAASKPDSNQERSLFDRAKQTIRSTKEDITHIVGPSAMPGMSAPAEHPELMVDRRFEALRKAVDGGGDKSGAPLLAMAQSLSELHMYLAGAEAARIGGYPPPETNLPTSLRAQAARLPQPNRRMLESFTSTSDKLVARETRRAKGRELVGQVTKACRDSIQGRYPLVRSAKKEVAPDDFTQMFGPGGRIDEYFRKELANYVDVSTTPWRLREGARGGLDGGASIAAFEKAHVIKDVFFRGGSEAPKITISLKPVMMDTTISTLTLDVDGQLIRYQHGPQITHTVSWPGTRGSNQVRLSLEPPLPQGNSGMVTEGAWALHRLFDAAQIQQGSSPERFTADLDVGGRKVRFEITAASVKNPFRLVELNTFSCPAGL